MMQASSGFQSTSVSSPDEQVKVNISFRKRIEPYPSGKRLYYSIVFKNREIILDSPLGMDFKDSPPLARSLVLVKEEKRTVNESWQTVHGKC